MDSPSKRSKHCSLGADMISQLPDNVIDKILTSLSTIEAAKTSVLSKNWMRGWKNISVLEFDYSLVKKYEKADPQNLMQAISRILFRHMGAIDGFTLHVPRLENFSELNSLIQILSEKKVKHLKVYFINCGSHVLPSYLFSCLQLSTLGLSRCVFNPPRSFGGFSQLITLVLNNANITSDFFGEFVSECQQLQQLRLQECSFREVYSINIIAPNLRTFIYSGCKLYIRIVRAPLLDRLELFDRCLNFEGVKKLYLDEFCTSLPALRELKVTFNFLKMQENDDVLAFNRYEGPEEYDFSCNKLQTVEMFYLNNTNAEIMFIKALLSKSPQLNEMIIHGVKEVSSLIGLIRSSPNLESLTVWMQKNEDDAGINRDEVLGSEIYDFFWSKLRTIELFNLNATNAEMAFIKTMLLKSPQLKEMTIFGVVEVSSLGLFIIISPYLERLTISFHNFFLPKMQKNDDAIGTDHYEVSGSEEYGFSCNRLQSVELINFEGTNAEMTFVKILLSKSSHLKEMTIHCVNEQRELQVLRKMIRFYRASATVDINVYSY